MHSSLLTRASVNSRNENLKIKGGVKGKEKRRFTTESELGRCSRKRNTKEIGQIEVRRVFTLHLLNLDETGGKSIRASLHYTYPPFSEVIRRRVGPWTCLYKHL